MTPKLPSLRVECSCPSPRSSPNLKANDESFDPILKSSCLARTGALLPWSKPSESRSFSAGLAVSATGSQGRKEPSQDPSVRTMACQENRIDHLRCLGLASLLERGSPGATGRPCDRPLGQSHTQPRWNGDPRPERLYPLLQGSPSKATRTEDHPPRRHTNGHLQMVRPNRRRSSGSLSGRSIRRRGRRRSSRTRSMDRTPEKSRAKPEVPLDTTNRYH